MKTPVYVILAVAAALSGLAFARPATQQSLEDRVKALEAQLEEQSSENLALAEEVAEMTDLVEALVKYTSAQAKSAASMADTLDESEELGFTFGINPDSRHVMLAGWRTQLEQLQTNVPGKKAEKKKTARR